ncbi:unnamed protein product [Didymodactylos carnosus]|uniref:Uncharacterized protein n=1 Tax=Didymodactylos carnosus TaxID=1234261 RepID=A0A8S2FML5_9BILA|nr:unnamed protein product [Didymodactylos carnosus]CAF4287005.1 unnamed protein product [Didymodactylos carnosus]
MKIQELLETLSKQIKPANVTRWNAELLLIKSIVFIGQNELTEITNATVKRLQLQEANDTDPFSHPIYFVAAVLDPSFKWYRMSEMRYNILDATDLKENIFSFIMTECKFELKSTQEKSYSNQSPPQLTGTETVTRVLLEALKHTSDTGVTIFRKRLLHADEKRRSGGAAGTRK